ncbi:hypothetical protein O3M35_004516 [Rhynocoris fuscipes]|uniref:RGS domain-containing protein n=1 Tax=Rhynocoris fuscipes TaxID=488301 RepID=A0AAW1CIB0_9HEMI
MTCTGCSKDHWWTREELDRWTNSINQLLINSRGRQAFHQFLIERSLIESNMTLGFWEMLDDAINFVKEPNISRSELNRELKKLYGYADEGVNLDATQMKLLYDCRRKEDMKEIESTLNIIKEGTVNLLRDDHRAFCQHHLAELNRSN